MRLSPGTVGDAVFSSCGTYRYRLRRRWGDGGGVVWIMLNPSTASAATDDPTLRSVQALSRAWGFGAATVVNLFALRSTDPAALLTHPDPVGPENDATLVVEAERAEVVVAAWGAHRAVANRGLIVAAMLGRELACVGTTRAGRPRHPLYVRSAPLMPWWAPTDI